MRPVLKPNGRYHNNIFTMVGASGIGQNNSTRCLALCIDEEINRLNMIIMMQPLAGGEIPVSWAIEQAVLAAPIPVNISMLHIGVVPNNQHGFAGILAGNGFAAYDSAIRALPQVNKNLVDIYIQYKIIQRNLQYNIAMDQWPFNVVPEMIIGNIPYAVSAMQDARRQVILAGAGAQIYSHQNVMGIGASIAVQPPQGVRVLQHFSINDINNHINNLYTAWETNANGHITPYQDAAAELVNELGPYCAYCEANLKTQIDVEHLLPKGRGHIVNGIRQGFSSFARFWLNFLPACPRCNSTKGSHPNKIDITNAAAGLVFQKNDPTQLVNIAPTVAGGGDAKITDLEYYKIFTDYYQFPLEQASYQNIGFALWDVNANFGAGQIDNTPIPAQLTWNINAVDESNKVVQVNMPHQVGISEFRVYIDDGTYGATVVQTPAGAVHKVSNMRHMCGLNAINANGIDTDRRVLERTEAWFMALEAMNRIVNDLTGIPGGTPVAIYNRVYALWRDNTIRIIKEKGFLSVWLKIFSAFSHPLWGALGAAAPVAAVPPLVGIGGAEVPIFPYDPATALANGTPFNPMIGGAGGIGGVVPVRSTNALATPMSLAQDIAQTILQTGERVSNAAQNAAGISLGIAAPVPPAVIPMPGNAGVGLAATWAAAGAPQIAQAEAAARKAGAARSRYFPNTNWDQVP